MSMPCARCVLVRSIWSLKLVTSSPYHSWTWVISPTNEDIDAILHSFALKVCSWPISRRLICPWRFGGYETLSSMEPLIIQGKQKPLTAGKEYLRVTFLWVRKFDISVDWQTLYSPLYTIEHKNLSTLYQFSVHVAKSCFNPKLQYLQIIRQCMWKFAHCLLHELIGVLYYLYCTDMFRSLIGEVYFSEQGTPESAKRASNLHGCSWICYIRLKVSTNVLYNVM